MTLSAASGLVVWVVHSSSERVSACLMFCKQSAIHLRRVMLLLSLLKVLLDLLSASCWRACQNAVSAG